MSSDSQLFVAVAQALRRTFATPEEAFLACSTDHEARRLLNTMLPFVKPIPNDSTPRTVSVCQAYILGKKHSGGACCDERIDAKIPSSRLAACIVGNPHLQAYMMGALHFAKDRLSAADLLRGLARVERGLLAAPVDLALARRLIAAWDSSSYVCRDGCLYIEDFKRLYAHGDWLSSSASTLPEERSNSVDPMAEGQRRRRANASAEALMRAGRENARLGKQTRSLLALVSRLRDEVALARAVAAEHLRSPRRGSVVLEPDPGDLAAAPPGRRDCGHIAWRLHEDVIIPSPVAAFMLADRARTGLCTALECQLALLHAGIAVSMTEVFLLMVRYHGGGSSDVAWAAMLQELGAFDDAAEQPPDVTTADILAQLSRPLQVNASEETRKAMGDAAALWVAAAGDGATPAAAAKICSPLVLDLLRGGSGEQGAAKSDRPGEPLLEALAAVCTTKLCALQQALRAFDPEGTGRVSVLEFKYAMMTVLGRGCITRGQLEAVVTKFGCKMGRGSKRDVSKSDCCNVAPFLRAMSPALALLATERRATQTSAQDECEPLAALAGLAVQLHSTFASLVNDLVLAAANTKWEPVISEEALQHVLTSFAANHGSRLPCFRPISSSCTARGVAGVRVMMLTTALGVAIENCMRTHSML